MRPKPLQDLLDGIAENLRAKGVNVNILDVGSNHPYTCKCEVCLKWWIQVGPEIEEEDEEGNPTKWNWGPFTEEEINAHR